MEEKESKPVNEDQDLKDQKEVISEVEEVLQEIEKDDIEDYKSQIEELNKKIQELELVNKKISEGYKKLKEKSMVGIVTPSNNDKISDEDIIKETFRGYYERK